MILRAKNITARQFAEEIGIQPSGMSHILGGRNNPSLDFAIKVLRRYPEIDANWLLLGKGAMYGESENREVRSENPEEKSVNNERQGEMDFGTADNSGFETVEDESEPMPKAEEYQATYVAVPPKDVERNADLTPRPPSRVDVGGCASPEKRSENGEADLERVMLIYSDNSYEFLTPRR